MATGRTLEKHTRIYFNGYDFSGFSRSIGPLEQTYDEPELTTWTDGVKGYLPGMLHTNIGTYNAVFDNTATTGLHTLLREAAGGYYGLPIPPGASALKTLYTVIAKGIRAAPAAGDPAFCGIFRMKAYQPVDDGGALTVTMPFSGWDAGASGASLIPTGNYNPWGVLLHADSAETGANTGTGIDNPTGGQTLFGGTFFYHTFAMAGQIGGSVTLSVDHSSDDSAYVALPGATSGAILYTGSNARNGGLAYVSTGTVVRQYLRWQLALVNMTSVTFACAFCRNYHA